MGVTASLKTGHVGESRLTLAGYETRMLELHGEGPPLLLIHGFADSADTWRPVMDRLGAAGRAAYAIDLPGFGTASGLDFNSPVMPQFDRFVAEAVDLVSDRYGGGDLILAGNSLGGALSLRAAERDDLSVAGIIPIAPAGLSMARWLLIIESQRALNLVLRSPLPLPGPVVRTAVAQAYTTLAFSSPAKADVEVVRRFTSHMDNRTRVAEVLEIGRRMFPELRNPFRLPKIDVPVLVIWGSGDRMVHPSGADRLLEMVPSSKVQLFDACGHCPQVEDPDRVVELILGFPGA